MRGRVGRGDTLVATAAAAFSPPASAATKSLLWGKIWSHGNPEAPPTGTELERVFSGADFRSTAPTERAFVQSLSETRLNTPQHTPKHQTDRRRQIY